MAKTKMNDIRNTTRYQIENKMYPAGRSSGVAVSGIMTECLRVPWYRFRWCKSNLIPAVKKRIFERGALEEARIVKDLISIGARVLYAVGDQLKSLMSSKHEVAKPDGIAYGLPEYPDEFVMLEFKTTKSTYFNPFLKQGIQSNQTYSGQVHRTMGHLQRSDHIFTRDENKNKVMVDVPKLYGKIDKTLFIVGNKNDEARSYEFVKYDEQEDKRVEDRVNFILMSDKPPSRLIGSLWYKCNSCEFEGICHHDQTPDRNCRTCSNVEWHLEGKIKCGLDKRTLSYEEQGLGCIDGYELGIPND